MYCDNIVPFVYYHLSGNLKLCHYTHYTQYNSNMSKLYCTNKNNSLLRLYHIKPILINRLSLFWSSTIHSINCYYTLFSAGQKSNPSTPDNFSFTCPYGFSIYKKIYMHPCIPCPILSSILYVTFNQHTSYNIFVLIYIPTLILLLSFFFIFLLSTLTSKARLNSIINVTVYNVIEKLYIVAGVNAIIIES